MQFSFFNVIMLTISFVLFFFFIFFFVLGTCPFGRAHVDTPKGDLDASLSVGGYNELVLEGSTVYPYGTTEGYPLMEDTAGNLIDNTAHDYMECSNKGLCDRTKGECECLPGYDGAACQRASCPSKANSNTPGSGPTSSTTSNIAFKIFNGKSAFNGRSLTTPQVDQCSGHGTCMTIEQLAFLDYGNSYDLWDKQSTMGCKCDPGYTGPDCSERTCVHGIDPLYTDDTSARVTHTTVRIESSDADALSGEYAIRFWDASGEDYITKGIPVTGNGIVDGVAKTHCDAVREAFVELPNRVVPAIECSQDVIDTDRGVEYTLKFIGNPGKLRQLEIDEFLDGSRTTVVVSSGTLSVGVHTKVVGESVDYFAQRCEGITVKVLADTASDDTWTPGNVRPGSLGYLSGPEGPLTAAEIKILKKCLGDSDWDPENNVEVADWDYGVVVENDGVDSYNMIGAHPHAIKVVPVETEFDYSTQTPGSYHLVWYDEDATGKEFRVANLNSDANDVSEAYEMYVYTTKGTVQQMGYGSESKIADNSIGGASSTRIVGYFDKNTNRIYTNYDTSCQNNPDNNHVCVEKGDKLFVIDSCWGRGELGVGSPSPNSIFGGTDLYACADSTIPNKDSGNIYTVTKVYTIAPGSNSAASPADTIDITSDITLKRIVDTHIIEVDASFGWQGLQGDPENSNTSGDDTTWSDNTGVVILFHFTPHKEGTYEYVSECSNRGICDRDSALCKCFSGYTSHDCSVQNILALSDADKAAMNKKTSS
jgi:LysM repeat protein